MSGLQAGEGDVVPPGSPRRDAAPHAGSGPDGVEPPTARITAIPGPERGIGDRGREAVATALSRLLAGTRRVFANARGVGMLVWLAMLIAVLTIFLVRERHDLNDFGRAIRTASFGWLMVALAIQFGIVGLLGLQQWLIYRLLGRRLSYWLLLRLVLRRNMVSTIVPAGGPLAVAMQVRRLAGVGVPPAIGLFGEIISGSVGTITVILLLLPVTVGLLIAGEATAPEVVATVVLAVVLVALVALLVFALRPAGLPAALDRRLPARFRSGIAEVRSQRVSVCGMLPVVLNALAIDVAGIGLLWASGHAVTSGFTVVDASIGYIVGTAFLLVTPVFGGLGVVEFGMSAVLAVRHLSAADALASVIVFRGFELWLPLMLGIAAEPLVRRGSVVVAQGGVRGVIRRLPAVAVAVTGILTVLSVLGPHEGPERFRSVSEDWVFALPSLARTVALIAGLLLLALAWGLWRRRRLAWMIAVVALLAATVAHAVKGHDPGFALVSAVTLLVLGVRRDEFRVRTAIPTIGAAAGLATGSLLVAVLYGTAGFWLLDRRDFGQDFGIGQSVRATVRIYLGLGSGELVPRTHYARWFLDSITVTGIVSLVVAAFAVWRPLAWRRLTYPRELTRARDLIARYGDSSLDTFKGWDDKQFWFAPDAAGMVAFRVDSGCALALGDPVARDDAAFPLVLAGFVDWADSNGWRVAFHQVSPARVAAYRAIGFNLLKIGEDAVVDLRTFSLDGRSMKSLRSSLRRVSRDGYRTVIHRPPHSPDLLDRLRSVSDGWLRIEGRRERGFTLGHWSDSYIAACPVAALEGPDGAVVAFANLIGDGAPGETTIDLMRRHPDAPNSAMDVLFLGLFQASRAAGYDAFSLGMVPWVALGEEPTAPPVERALARMNTRMERFFSVRGLYAYKDKFGPRWEPRYLAYPSDLDLPRITVAIVRVTERSVTGLPGWPGRPTRFAGDGPGRSPD